MVSPVLRRVILDKIGSVTKRAKLAREVQLAPVPTPEAGGILAVTVCSHKTVYNTVEDVHGRNTHVKAGDVLAGALGHRNALHGYTGVVPESLAVGDTIHLLNQGGVLGLAQSHNPDVGPPFQCEVLGAILSFPYLGERVGVPATVRDNAIEPISTLGATPPIVAVLGTCMSAGKTSAACEVIRGLTHAGHRIAAAKCTGVSLYRDVLNMADYGATHVLTFTDAGVVTTSDATAAAVTRTLIGQLARTNPDAILLELGDGIAGEYGVHAILNDRELTARFTAIVLAANDPVGAWGGVRMLAEQYGLSPAVISGPVTDNRVGTRYIETTLGIAAANARTEPRALTSAVIAAIDPTRADTKDEGPA